MNLKIQHRNLELSPTLTTLIEKRSRKIEKVLPTFASHDLDLHLTLEKLPRKNQYRTVLVLTMPQNAIRAEDIEDNPTGSVLRTFDELMRKVKKFKSQLNREKLWKRQWVALPAKASAEGASELREAVNQNLDKLENYIRRELFHESLVENIPRGLVEPQAVVDEVFLEVVSRLNGKPDNLSVDQWMFQIAREKLQSRIRALQAAREEPHIEESPRISSRWDDEELNFYHPDEAFRLEDIMPDERSANPEQSLAREEAEERLQKAIARLPKLVRESFVLFALEGFNSDEVAMITGTDPSQVLENVEKARKVLREGLGAMGGV